MRMVESRSCVQREGVYRWFSFLSSAQRAEFLCGLLDLCVPIELRFLGSCLEDLARKDYHSLRDAEIKANNPVDLSGLTNVTDEVVRSKLLVSLALLGSDNREAAGVLYRTLTHIDTVINNYGLALNDGRTEEQFLLLFTMASHHPAFSFHQKQLLRQQLSHIQDVLQVSGEAQVAPGAAGDGSQPQHQQQTTTSPSDPSAACSPCYTQCTCWTKNHKREAGMLSGQGSGRQDREGSQEIHLPPPLPPPPPPLPLPAAHGLDAAALNKNHQEGTPAKVVIEGVMLSGATHKSEDTDEYVFEVSWSDGSVWSVGRSHQEVTELLAQLSQASSDGMEKFLPQSTELDARSLTALPCHVLQHHSVQLFFTSTRPLSPNCPASLHPSPSTPVHPLPFTLPHPPSSLPTAPVAPTCPLTSNLGCAVQYRGTNRAVYRVASVQPVVSTHSPVVARPSPHVSCLPPPPLPPAQLSSLPTTGDPSPHPYSQHHLHPPQSPHLSYSQTRPQSLSHPQAPSHSQAGTPEHSGILDWLRRLRLHKYYPVFKQLTMEEFLALTEEDLNKYDLTQGAKKKLKTQLELQKSLEEMKMEKRPCSGIARVMPSSHMGPSTHPTSSAGEVRVEAVSTDSSSSSGYSSSSCSPRTPLTGEHIFDRTRDNHRRPEAVVVGPEKERSCLFLLNSGCPSGSGRPTAQVLPVQTEPCPPPPLPSSCSFGLPQSPSYHHPQQAPFPQTLLSPLPNPARILASPRKPRPPPLLCTEDRTSKPMGGSGFGPGLGVGRMGVRLESLFPGSGSSSSSSSSTSSSSSSSTLQDSLVCRGLAGGCAGLMVDTSSALTSTSNSLHHVSHPPLHFHLSSSSSPSPSGYYFCPPDTFSSSLGPSTKSSSSISASGFVPAATNVPVVAIPGNSYYPPEPASSPAPSSPSSACPLDQSPGHSSSVCVCSSCGCRGNCGAYGALPGYAAGYLQQFSGPSLFTLGPLLHLSPLIASSSAVSPFSSYPVMVPPPPLYHQDQQQGLAFYQAHGTLGNTGQKPAAGSLSCYNCGANGHRAEECKQPPMDSAQQGTFRLKYTPRSDSKDSGD